MGVATLVFLFSFLQYCLQRVDVVRLIPMALLLAGTFLFLLFCSRRQRRDLFAQLARPAVLMIVALATVPALLSSLYRGSWYPFEYGMVMVVTLLSARLLLSCLGFAALLRAFFYATSTGMVVVAAFTIPELLASVGAERYYPFHFEPNRIAFFAVTAIPAQIWMAKGCSYALLLSSLCGLVTVAASSRGSTAALLIGSALTLTLAWLHRTGHRWPSRKQIGATLVLLLGATVLGAARPALLPDAGEYLWNKLDLGSRARGLDSGFTGRTNGWSTLLEILPKTSWLVGNGYRTSDEDFDFSVDSGYLASSYELGLFSTTVVLLKYFAVLTGLAAAYLHGPPQGGCLLYVSFTLVVFLANGFVHRVLFGYGDPASLFALFCFVSSPADAAAAVRA